MQVEKKSNEMKEEAFVNQTMVSFASVFNEKVARLRLGDASVAKEWSFSAPHRLFRSAFS